MISEEDWNIFSQYSTSSNNRLNQIPKTLNNLNLLLHNVNWDSISKHFLLSEGFMYRYSEYLNWSLIFQHQILSHEFLRNNLSKLYRNKGIVSRYQHLSEMMIREFDYLLDWNILSAYQKLSEPFIEEFKEKVDWDNILSYQELTEEFKKKHSYRLNCNNDSSLVT